MKPIIPAAVRRRLERMAIADNHGSVILTWAERYSAFILMVAADNVSWSHGYTSTVLSLHEAVKLELFISEKTAPIISALQRTSSKGGRS